MTPIAALSVLRNVEVSPDGLTPRTFEEAGIRAGCARCSGCSRAPGTRSSSCTPTPART